MPRYYSRVLDLAAMNVFDKLLYFGHRHKFVTGHRHYRFPLACLLLAAVVFPYMLNL